ncbi:MAG: class I SAM-dependent RNA methyltransferase [Clostridia bacterium]|nr:class I SAM-dependent RNA methyltransferase [Clostridia bacterium]
MEESYTFVATCLFGLERLVREEIESLGYRHLSTMDGRVEFSGDLSAIARCSLWLRCAERLYLSLGSFPARSFTELFDGTETLPWERWIGKNDAFPVKGHSVKSRLASVPDCQSIIKKAVVRRLSRTYGISWFPEEGTRFQIVFFLLNDTVTLMIDTSGIPLHKRGYRPAAGIAPLRETLACAMVKLSRPREDVLLWDPFCGSGTIPVEAALLMTQTAPGLLRSFAAEDYPWIPGSVWQDARAEARDIACPDTSFEAYASDIDGEMVRIAEENIRRAGMQNHVRTFRRDALSIETGGRRGTIVCNPPYGERMMTPEEVRSLYRKMGAHFLSLDRWQIYVISSDETFEKDFGRKADKVRKLYNGMIPCGFFQYFKRPSGTFMKQDDAEDSARERQTS